MKKVKKNTLNKCVLIFLTITIILICFNGCYTKQLSSEQSEINIADYISEIKKIADLYGCEMVDSSDSWETNAQEFAHLYYIYMCMSDSEDISILLSFSSEDGVSVSDNTGSISIDYTIDTNYQEEKYNIDLFVKLVNFVSDIEISKEYCEDFLEAAEQDSKGGQHAKRYKSKYFDFIGYRYLSYTLDYNNVATLSFGGVTKPMAV